jgi:hypothetical protein
VEVWHHEDGRWGAVQGIMPINRAGRRREQVLQCPNALVCAGALIQCLFGWVRAFVCVGGGRRVLGAVVDWCVLCMPSAGFA